MKESCLERYAVAQIKKVGGCALKWICSGKTGAPDRICIFPGGRIVFVEFKRPGLKDGRSVRQKKFARILEDLGCDVQRVGSKEEFTKILEEAGGLNEV